MGVDQRGSGMVDESRLAQWTDALTGYSGNDILFNGVWARSGSGPGQESPAPDDVLITATQRTLLPR